MLTLSDNLFTQFKTHLCHQAANKVRGQKVSFYFLFKSGVKTVKCYFTATLNASWETEIKRRREVGLLLNQWYWWTIWKLKWKHFVPFQMIFRAVQGLPGSQPSDWSISRNNGLWLVDTLSTQITRGWICTWFGKQGTLCSISDDQR